MVPNRPYTPSPATDAASQAQAQLLGSERKGSPPPCNASMIYQSIRTSRTKDFYRAAPEFEAPVPELPADTGAWAHTLSNFLSKREAKG